MKSVWNGSIGFGLVNIPVRVYLATREIEPPLHSLCKNGHRIVYKRWCPVENREVSWQELKKGFELSPDKFIVLEHVVAIRAFQKGLLMHTLHYSDEILSIDDIAELKNLEKPEKKELDLAELLIQKMSKNSIDMEQFKDAYAEALRELIKAKAAGKEYVVEASKETKAAKNLIDSLTESLNSIK